MSASKRKAIHLVVDTKNEEEPVVATGGVPAAEEQSVSPIGPRLRITLRKSGIGYKYDQKRTLAALGLRRLHMTVEQPDNPSVRGMIRKVQHLVEVEEIGQA